MKVPMSLVPFLFLFRFSTFWVSAAVIDSQARSYALSPLTERDVTYGSVSSDAANSAVCNDGQRKILEQGMRDAVRLAKAGADGLAIILDMLTEEKTTFNKLSETERHRYQETYYTFFGKIEYKSQWPLFRKRASFIKRNLDRLSALTIETWPEGITIYCDSSLYQNKDNNGRTADQIPSLQESAPRPGFKFFFDTVSNQWIETSPFSNCSNSKVSVEAYTIRGSKLNSKGVLERQDRITFCPSYFGLFKPPTTGQSVPASSLIRPGLPLSAFNRKAGRAVLHEHLHTFAIQRSDNDNTRLNDVDGTSSYGPLNAKRLAANPATRARANRNVENVVYWCISMFYSTWDWSSTYAAEIGGGEGDKITPSPSLSPWRLAYLSKTAPSASISPWRLEYLSKTAPRSTSSSSPSPTMITKPSPNPSLSRPLSRPIPPPSPSASPSPLQGRVGVSSEST